MKQPDYVQRFVEEVAKLEGKKPLPLKSIRYRAGRGSGYCHYKWVYSKKTSNWSNWNSKNVKVAFDYLTVNSAQKWGVNEKRDKMVLLHEMAHAYSRAKSGHNTKFWEKAWGYYEHFRSELDWEAVKKSEFRYKAKAKVVYDRLYPEVKAELAYGQLTLDISLTI